MRFHQKSPKYRVLDEQFVKLGLGLNVSIACSCRAIGSAPHASEPYTYSNNLTNSVRECASLHLMEKVTGVNPDRIQWCCNEWGITLEQLASDVTISLKTLQQTMRGEDTLSIAQLRKIATYFDHGLLFYLEEQPVNESSIHSAQFRTITNQKATISPQLRKLIKRLERQREVYLSLLEILREEELENPWNSSDLSLSSQDISYSARKIRNWLGLHESVDFKELRNTVEDKGIIVFLSNGYKGRWQIDKDDSVRGFSLHYDRFPLIAIKKQDTDGPQAFTLMHELAHLLFHGDSFIDDENDFLTYSDKEKVANEFAGHALIPEDFLPTINLNGFVNLDATEYDNFLQGYRKRWCVSTEVILRRLLDSGRIGQQEYQGYRRYRHSKQSAIASQDVRFDRRARNREPIKMFGERFVRTVFDALHSQQITLARASSYLDYLKIDDLHKLDADLCA